MASEFRPPTPEEIASGIFKSGRTPEQFMGIIETVQQGIKEGVVRTDLSCWEHKERFFEMAQRMYVQNGEMRFKDVEIGIHEGQCESSLCVRMAQAYFELLRPSQAEDSPQVAVALESLEKELMMGRERADLVGEPSGYYDSDTGETLKVVKAVDITDKCRLEQGSEALLVYIRSVKGYMVDIREYSVDGGRSGVAFRLNGNMFVPEDLVFRRSVDSMRIDPKFLHAIIVANAPQENKK